MCTCTQNMYKQPDNFFANKNTNIQLLKVDVPYLDRFPTHIP